MAKKDTSRRSRHRTLRDRRIRARLAGHTLTERPSLPIPECTKRPHGGDIAHTGFGESGDLGPPVSPTSITPSASARSVPQKRRRGKCDGCDRKQMVLTKIQSGQQVCQSCLREIRGPDWSKLATLKQVESLQMEGYRVDEKLTKEEYNRIRMSQTLKERGVAFSPTASLDDLSQLVSSTSVYTWCTSVAGVSFQNNDGSSRQTAISECHVGDILSLNRQSTNPHDSNAIAVFNSHGNQIGFLPRDVATVVAAWIDSGSIATAVVRRITSSDEFSGRDYVDIVVLHARASVDSNYFRECVRRIRSSVFAGETPQL